MFKVRGVYNGEELEVTWTDDGFLTGRPDIVGMANILANESDYVYGQPGGPCASGASVLKSERPAFHLLASLLRNIELIEGDLTPLEPLPEGAIS